MNTQLPKIFAAPELKAGQELRYLCRDQDGNELRVKKGHLVTQTKTGWIIQPVRQGKVFRPPTVEVPCIDIMTKEQMEERNKHRSREKEMGRSNEERRISEAKCYKVRSFRRLVYGRDESIPPEASTPVNNLEAHPLAEIIPEMSEQQYHDLLKSIRQYGQLEPCWTFEGKLIDGRHRQKACNHLGIKCTTREWSGEGRTLAAFIVGLNATRRHLTKDQLTLVALGMLPILEAAAGIRNRNAGASHKGNQHTGITKLELTDDYTVSSNVEPIMNTPSVEKPKRNLTAVESAAKAAGISVQMLQHAKKIVSDSPELVEDLRTGKTTLSQIKKQSAKKPIKSLLPTINWQVEGPRLRNILERIIVADDGERSVIIEEAKKLVCELP
ncbi:MAG: hypothetical protein PHF56_20285 [Desulfuromonadaceae bacterium]|nr:hypothetical protein [Desulfuromonadaceae bacterium]